MMKRIWRYWLLGVLSLWAVAGMAQYPVKWEVHTVNWSPGYCYYDETFKRDSLYVNNRLIEIGVDLEALDSRRYIMAFYQCPSVVITTDYGESWKRIFDFGGSTRVGNVEMHVVDVEWVTPQVVYILIDSVEVFGDRTSTVLLRSRDGGESFEAIPIWTRAQTQQSGWELRPIDISFADSLNGIMGCHSDGREEGERPVLLYTTDGGDSWDTVDAVRGILLMAKSTNVPAWTDSDYLKALAPGHWVVFTWDSVFQTTDWGETWERVNWKEQIPKCQQPGCSFQEVEFVTKTTWFLSLRVRGQTIIEKSDLVVRTTDGGRTFETVLDTLPPTDPRGYEHPFMAPLRSICFADTLYGFAMGFEGKIWKTTDGGRSWVLEDNDLLEPPVNPFMRRIDECVCKARDTVMALAQYRWLRYNRQGILPMPVWASFEDPADPYQMITERPYVLRWHPVEGATWYQLRLVQVQKGGIRVLDIPIDTVLSDTSIVLDLPNGTLYFAYIRAGNEDVVSNWRETRFTVLIGYTGIGEEKEIGGRWRRTLVVPNPGDGTIRFRIPWSGEWTVALIGQLGERIEERSLGRRQAWETVTIDFSHQPSGFYLLYCRSDRGWWVEPVVIVK